MSRHRGFAARAVAGVLLQLPPACGGGDDTAVLDRAEWPLGVQAHVDSGNVAYRAQDYAGARAHFSEAARLGPDVPAAWFGLYMAEHALGNQAAADSALARSKRLGDATAAHPPAR